jgi:L-alanine-DL-glutamate epimerase-like enolase superfamily enzyme
VKIERIETFVVDAGWRPWTFVKIQTDDGLTGYGECSDGRNPRGVVGCVADLEPILLGQDPRPIEALNAAMYRLIRQSPGGVAQKAVAGIDAALWDIKAKALGVPVYELLGGPTRERIRVYWSHCGTSRATNGALLGTPPLRTMDDIAALGREVVARGFTALKTNIVFPGEPAAVYFPGFARGNYSGNSAAFEGGDRWDLNLSPALLRHIETLIGTFREAIGPDVGLALDLNFNFKTEGFARIAKALERFDLMWLEIDTYSPEALAWIKESTTTRICSGENLLTPRDYKPFLDRQAMDVVMIDVPWNGFTESKKIADLAAIYEVNIAPHNYYSHLSTLMSAHLCAVATNVRIMEIDIDDVPWKDELITQPLEIKDGHVILPARPGWGADLNEPALAKHRWDR